MGVDFAVGNECWNEDAGGICIGCGCCAEDPIERCESRIAVLEERIFNLQHDMRDPHKEFDFEQDTWVNTYYDYETPEHLIEEYEQQIVHYRYVLRSLRMKQREAVPA